MCLAGLVMALLAEDFFAVRFVEEEGKLVQAGARLLCTHVRAGYRRCTGRRAELAAIAPLGFGAPPDPAHVTAGHQKVAGGHPDG